MTHQSSQPSFGDLLRARRIELGLTQEQLAARIGDGIRQTDISRLERGRVALPRHHRLLQIAQALDIPPGELLARSGWAGADTLLAPAASAALGTAQAARDRGEPSVDADTVARLREALDTAQRLRSSWQSTMRHASAMADVWQASIERR